MIRLHYEMDLFVMRSLAIYQYTRNDSRRIFLDHFEDNVYPVKYARIWFPTTQNEVQWTGGIATQGCDPSHGPTIARC